MKAALFALFALLGLGAGCALPAECEAPRGSFCNAPGPDGLDLRATFGDGVVTLDDPSLPVGASCEVDLVGCTLLGVCEDRLRASEGSGIAIDVIDGESVYVSYQLQQGGGSLATVLTRCGP